MGEEFANTNANIDERKEILTNRFKILNKNIVRAAFNEAPSRISELIMKDGTTYSMGSIAYYLNENSVAYEGSKLWTRCQNNSVMQYAPDISISENTPDIVVVCTSGNTSMASDGFVRISVLSSIGTQPPSTTTNSTMQTVTADFADIGATCMIHKEKVIRARVL